MTKQNEHSSEVSMALEHEPVVRVFSTQKEVCLYAAEQIATLVRKNPSAVLGLPTGGTPLFMYEKLINYHKMGLDFSRAAFFNLDEYIGLSSAHPQSYRYYMKTNFFAHVNACEENIYIPNGMAKNIKHECLAYERAIKLKGCIDLMVLGIGANGHIGFCEPGTSFHSRTHRTHLTEQTRLHNARFFPASEVVPTHAITMGLATILEAGRILLLASGSPKLDAVNALLRKPISSDTPATILRRHKHVDLIADRDAFPRGRHLSYERPLYPQP